MSRGPKELNERGLRFSGRRPFHTEGTASAKALRRECTWSTQGAEQQGGHSSWSKGAALGGQIREEAERKSHGALEAAVRWEEGKQSSD